MRLTVDEYCKYFKMSKEMVNSKIRAKKLNYIIEEGKTYIIVTRSSLERDKREEINEEQKSTPNEEKQIIKPKTTVATVLALYQKENNFLKNKIVQLEAKIDKLIDDKEQMLRAERDKIEQIYSSKDEQLKNILELVNKKMKFEQEATTIHEVESFNHNNRMVPPENLEIVELKEYLKRLDLKSSQKKAIKRRFLDAYDNDVRVIHKDGKLYLDFSKYDYSDLLAY
ncbi:hypothetical protein FCU45_11155 [Sulfurimonas crateris]|uniref:Uncharacterized protein n=1 Tax=Sulfurimonas crateris TaxID=2574727 RepID=A0A4U2Z2B6_9BACT|nr:hypothetical protein [Sulfurimonas crateris]TKI68257.1 hypothetical protein FCU45_11155 [Sulfurimonas crateris]